MRCGEKKFIVETSDGIKHTVRGRTQAEARKKARELCGNNITIYSVRSNMNEQK